MSRTTKGKHLSVTTNKDGTVQLVWNWDALVKEVAAATGGIKQDIVKVTEEKVKKTRKKINE